MLQVCSVVFGYLLAVCFKWSPQTEQYLKTIALPVWAALLFFVGMCGGPAEDLSKHICAYFPASEHFSAVLTHEWQKLGENQPRNSVQTRFI